MPDDTQTVIPLPKWTDAPSVTAFIVSTATFVIGVLTMTGVMLPANAHAEIQAWAGIAGIAIAAGVQIANFIRVTVLHKAAIAAGYPVKP